METSDLSHAHMSDMGQYRSRKRTKAGRYTSDISYEELEKYFHLPTSKACVKLGVGLTILKRICRRFGLARWPYKKPCKSLQQMSDELQEDNSTGAASEGTAYPRREQPAPKQPPKRVSHPARALPTTSLPPCQPQQNTYSAFPESYAVYGHQEQRSMSQPIPSYPVQYQQPAYTNQYSRPTSAFAPVHRPVAVRAIGTTDFLDSLGLSSSQQQQTNGPAVGPSLSRLSSGNAADGGNNNNNATAVAASSGFDALLQAVERSEVPASTQASPTVNMNNIDIQQHLLQPANNNNLLAALTNTTNNVVGPENAAALNQLRQLMGVNPGLAQHLLSTLASKGGVDNNNAFGVNGTPPPAATMHASMIAPPEQMPTAASTSLPPASSLENLRQLQAARNAHEYQQQQQYQGGAYHGGNQNGMIPPAAALKMMELSSKLAQLQQNLTFRQQGQPVVNGAF